MAKKRATDGQGSIRQRTDGRWEARYYINGTRKSIISKKNSKKPKEEVTIALNKILYEINNGLYIEQKKMTVSQWLDIWLTEYKSNNLKPRTMESYRSTIRLYILPAIGKKNIKDLRPDELQSLLNSMTNSGLSVRTVKYTNQILHSALNQAVKNNIVMRNICELVTLPKGSKKEMRVLSKVEQDLFCKYIKGQRYEFAFILCLATGLRVGELLGLRWRDVNFTSQTIHISQTLQRLKDEKTGKTSLQFGTPKTEKGKRSIPLLDNIATFLKEHKKKQQLEKLRAGNKWIENDLVFRTELGSPVEPKNLTRIINKTVDKINNDLSSKDRAVTIVEPFKRFGIHTLRHTFATRALEAGMQPKVLQEILGHSTITMTLDIYSHVLPDTKKESMQLLKNMFA